MYFSISGGSISFGGDQILNDINFSLHDGEKVAVVGRNGCGKTTLLRLIKGEDFPGAKDINMTELNGIRVGMLSQLTVDDHHQTFEEELLCAFSHFNEMKAELDSLVLKMETDPDPDLAQRYTELEAYYNLLGGYYYLKDYEQMVVGFGFGESDKQKRITEFSGGQRTKIAFMKLLLSKPDILLLDEPTNHLDMATVEWLEGYIKSYPGAVVIVSHDRMFLDRTVSVVYEIEYGTIRRYVGDYSHYTSLKQQAYLQQKKLYEAQQKEIEKTEALIERFRYKATKAAMVQSKIKALDRSEKVLPPMRFDTKAFFADLTPTTETGGRVIKASGLVIGYDTPIATVDFELLKGQKMGVIGDNGIGKSTLLKTLMGLIRPLEGSIMNGVNLQKGYFDQQMVNRAETGTLLDNYRAVFPTLTNTEARSDLGAFLFGGEDVFKNMSTLSGGEKVRLEFCKIFKRKPNLLILDEPTNHLDIVGKDALEDMLKGYSGSLICVSHDRYFIKQVCDCLLVFGQNGVTFYPFGFDEYEARRVKEAPEAVAAKMMENKGKPAAKEKKLSPLKEKEKLTRKIKKCEEQIALKEQKIEGIKQELALPDVISDYLKIGELSAELDNEEISLSALYSEWEELNTKLEEL